MLNAFILWSTIFDMLLLSLTLFLVSLTIVIMTVLLLLLLIELCYGLISFIFIFLLSLDSLSQLADVMHGMSQMIGGIDPEKITLRLVLDLIL